MKRENPFGTECGFPRLVEPDMPEGVVNMEVFGGTVGILRVRSGRVSSAGGSDGSAR